MLPPRIVDFHEAYPGIATRLLIRDTRGVLDDLLAGKIEAGFVGARLMDGKLRYTPFASDCLALVAPGLPQWQRLRSLSLDALKKLPLLLREPGSGTRFVLEQALARAGHDLREFQVVAELGSTGAIKEAIKAGLGASVISERAVSAELQSDSLVKLAIRGLAPLRREFYLVLVSGRTVSAVCEGFLEHLDLRL
jgi:DNA-binding transcriptional LysR family regulator